MSTMADLFRQAKNQVPDIPPWAHGLPATPEPFDIASALLRAIEALFAPLPDTAILVVLGDQRYIMAVRQFEHAMYDPMTVTVAQACGNDVLSIIQEIIAERVRVGKGATIPEKTTQDTYSSYVPNTGILRAEEG